MILQISKKYSYLRYLRFFENENFDQQKRVAFRKSQKSAKSLHPTVDPGGKKLKQHHNKARKLVPVPVIIVIFF